MVVETLRPNAGGTTTENDYYDGVLHNSDVNENYKQVDESIADEDATYVECTDGVFLDTYNVPNSSIGAGTINKITVYCRSKYGSTSGASMREAIRIGGTDYYGGVNSLTSSYVTYSYEWIQNPNTTTAWTWTNINDLEIGVENTGVGGKVSSRGRTTQVYVEVDYTEAVASVGSGAGWLFNPLIAKR